MKLNLRRTQRDASESNTMIRLKKDSCHGFNEVF